MQNPVKTLVIRFNNEIYPDEINCFRGAVVHAMDGANVLFHNHLEGDKLRYNYPLIQYKRIHRKAALKCSVISPVFVKKNVKNGFRLVFFENSPPP